VADAEASGARGTPTFFVGNRRHQGPYDARTLIAELEATQDGPPTDPTPPRRPPNRPQTATSETETAT
jgi:hypothetical protein